MESTSEMETALQFYEAARDNLSLVRVYCYCGNLEKVSWPHTLCNVFFTLFIFVFLSLECYLCRPPRSVTKQATELLRIILPDSLKTR